MLAQKSTVIIGLVVLATASVATSCPFCSSVSMTFTEEIGTMDVAAIGSLVDLPKPEDEQAIPKATFKIIKVIRGDTWVKVGDKIETSYYGTNNKERNYLLMGTDAPKIVWTSPLGLSKRAESYVQKIHNLPEKGAGRLEFFQEHLEDEDEMLARDAYDEFAKAPYKTVVDLKDKMHRDRLLKWLSDPEVPASRRRLYFTMLGICGKTEDLQFLESMMRSDERRQKAGLDAMIACYLLLGGEKGLPLVNDLFLKNSKAEYADTYAAIMAIRFHGNQIDKIDRKQLIKSLRLILERPSLADLVIPDLAGWKDWEVMDHLVELFKNANEESSWVRVPVVNYLRVCPLPAAKKHIEELKNLDAGAVKRAFLTIPLPSNDKEDDKETTSTEKTDEEPIAQQPVAPPDIDKSQTLPISQLASSVDTVDTDTDSEDRQGKILGTDLASISTGPVLATSAPTPQALNIFWIISVPTLSGVAFFFLLRMVLGVPILGQSRSYGSSGR